MVVKICYNMSQFDVFKISDCRLTKKAKSEIKEKIIDSLSYKNLSIISKIRGSEIVKMSYREEKKYLEKNWLTLTEIKEI